MARKKEKFTLLNNRKANLTGQAPLDNEHLTGQVRVNPFFNPSLSVIIAAVFAVVIMGFGVGAQRLYGMMSNWSE